jgi:hypothetical protein
VPPEDKQEQFESQKLWSTVTKNIIARDLDKATEEKASIEDKQRKIRQEREAGGDVWEPRFFMPDVELEESFKFRLFEYVLKFCFFNSAIFYLSKSMR